MKQENNGHIDEVIVNSMITIGWKVTKPETRVRRVQKTIEMLKANPRVRMLIRK